MNVDSIKRFGSHIFGLAYNATRQILGDDLPTTTSALAREFPPSLSAHLPYLGWDSINQLFQNESTCGLIMEVTPLGDLSEARHEILAQIFNDGMPEGIHVQVINWSSPKVGALLDRWSEARSALGGVYAELAKHRRAHLKNGIWNSMSRSEPMHVRDYRVFLAFEIKGQTDGEGGKLLREVYQVIEGTYKSLGGAVRVMKPNDLLDFMRAVLNPTSGLSTRTQPYDNQVSIRDQIVRKDTTMNVFRDRLITTAFHEGDKHGDEAALLQDDAKTERFEMRTFGADRFPENCNQSIVGALTGDFFNAQLQPVGSTITCLYFTPWPYDKSKSVTELKTMRMNQQASSPTGKIVPTIKLAADDWNQVNSDIQRGVKLSDMALMCVSITPEGEGERAERALRNVWTSAGFAIVRYDALHLQTLLACLPLTMGQGMSADFEKFKRLRKFPTSSMALLAPLQGEIGGSRLPHILFLGRKGQPFFWSPFANAEEGSGGGNHNTSVTGASGSGKSVLLQEIAVALLGSGAHVIVLDDGWSFANTCKIQNGQHIEFTLNGNLCLNPFSMYDHELAATDEEYRDECRESIRSLVLQMAVGSDPLKPPTKEETGAIAQAVNTVWDRLGRDAGISDVAKELSDTQGELGRVLKLGMSEYSEGGSYYSLYNGECTLAIHNPFTVFELNPIEAKKELRACVILGLLMLIRQRMKFGGRTLKKALFIDEAWQLLGDGAAGPFIEGFARRVRKEGGALITGTQSIADYERTAGGRACMNNSDWNIILRVKEEALNAFEKEGILQATEADLRILRSLKTIQGEYSECFIRGPGWKALGRLTLDKFSITLYSTSPDVLGRVENLMASGVPVGEAVAQVAFNKVTEPALVETDMNYARTITRIEPIRAMIDSYLNLDDGQRAKFIRKYYRELGGNNDTAA